MSERGTLRFPKKLNQHPATVGAESEDNMEFEERKVFYKQLLIDMSGQAAELLASGKAIEIDRSRSGLKLYSFRRKHEVVKRNNLKRGTEGDSANDL